jgi:hypothetical protein
MIQAKRQTQEIVLSPQIVTDGATVTARVDTLGCDYVTLQIVLGPELNTNAIGPTISVLSSDDTEVSNFATLIANRTDEDLTSGRMVRYDIDTKTKKRYLRLTVTADGTSTHNDIKVSCIAIKTRNEADPSSDAAIVGSGHVVVTL